MEGCLVKIAFDLDGTISRYPQAMIAMANLFADGGAEVFVLTAAAGEFPSPERPAEVRRRLDARGWNRFPAVCCESSEKPEFCRRLNVDVLIDDTDFKLNGTILLQVK